MPSPRRDGPDPAPSGSWIPLLAPPAAMGVTYAVFAYGRFSYPPYFLLEHAFVVALWVAATALAVWVIHRTPAPGPIRRWSAALALTLGYSSLFLIYAAAMVGGIHWGAPPSFTIVLRFLPVLFHVSEDLMVPPAVPALLLAFPFLAFGGLAAWKGSALEAWARNLTRALRGAEGSRRRLYLGAALLLPSFSAWSFLSSDTNLAVPTNFRNDPIVTFFSPPRSLFPMTPERVEWAAADARAREKVVLGEARTRNVILFIVDALRADHLSLYGYPRSTDALLSKRMERGPSRRIRLALSTGLESGCGILSILASKRTEAMSHLNYTLPDFFSDHGFKTLLYLSGDHHWYNFKDSYGRNIDVFRDGTSFTDRKDINNDQGLLAEARSLPPDDGGRHFFYFHLMSVHESGTRDPSYMRYRPFLNPITPGFRAVGDASERTRLAVNLYDNSVIQADAILEGLLGILEGKGYLRDSLTVVTADHGQLLGERGQYGHSILSTELGVLQVPLLFLASEPLPPFPQEDFALSLDVAPTLADLAGLGVPSCWHGESLLRPRRQPWSYHFSPSYRTDATAAVVHHRKGRILKYSRLLRGSPEGSVDERLIDLGRDPLGKTDLLRKVDPGLLREMRERFKDHILAHNPRI